MSKGNFMDQFVQNQQDIDGLIGQGEYKNRNDYDEFMLRKITLLSQIQEYGFVVPTVFNFKLPIQCSFTYVSGLYKMIGKYYYDKYKVVIEAPLYRQPRKLLDPLYIFDPNVKVNFYKMNDGRESFIKTEKFALHEIYGGVQLFDMYMFYDVEKNVNVGFFAKNVDEAFVEIEPASLAFDKFISNIEEEIKWVVGYNESNPYAAKTNESKKPTQQVLYKHVPIVCNLKPKKVNQSAHLIFPQLFQSVQLQTNQTVQLEQPQMAQSMVLPKTNSTMKESTLPPLSQSDILTQSYLSSDYRAHIENAKNLNNIAKSSELDESIQHIESVDSVIINNDDDCNNQNQDSELAQTVQTIGAIELGQSIQMEQATLTISAKSEDSVESNKSGEVQENDDTKSDSSFEMDGFED